MAYIHQISFEIDREQLGMLGIGSPLQRVLGFLRIQLPSSEGFITSRARYALTPGKRVLVEVESVWEHYGDLERHRASQIAEDKVMLEFGDGLSDLKIQEFAEVD
ncbi:MAG: hypothetical protein AB7D57_12910 [Desulfovibrionaceae bacterium]